LPLARDLQEHYGTTIALITVGIVFSGIIMAETNSNLLIDAFSHFMQASSSLETAYQELQQHTRQLSLDLEQANRDLKQSLAEKERVESYLKNILQSLTRGVLVTDLSGAVVLCNRAASQQLGVELQPGSELLPSLKIHPFVPYAQAAIADPQSQAEEVELEINRNDQNRIVSISRTPVYEESHTCIGISFILSDVTLLRTLERENRRREWLSAIGEMALELSQQIHQPLGTIDQAASLLKNKLPATDEQHSLAEEISYGVESLNDVVVKLKALSGRARQSISTNEIVRELTAKPVKVDRRAKTKSSMNIVTCDPATLQVLDTARQIAASRTTVLLQAESGTGKELLARFIHENSPRTNRPFIAVNCAAVPEQLLESELFGHEKGSFTGASSQKIGKFEAANNGTILLDEISEMPLLLQAKLLRVLQEHEIDRVGGLQPIKIDVRVIATTNRRLVEQVRSGAFREDLYYRLNVVPLQLPPLRERLGDIAPLAEHFCQRYAREMRDGDMKLSSATIDTLMQHQWPGNIRELENVIQRAVALCHTSVIEPSDLMLTALSVAPTVQPLPQVANLSVEESERLLILKALEETGGNRTHAAKKLKISLRTLRNRIREYRDQGVVITEPGVKILPTANSVSA